MIERRLQNSPYFCAFKYARAVKQKVWNEAENRERDLGRDAKNTHALRACEARALRARKTLTACFTDFFTDFEKKKPTVLPVYLPSRHLLFLLSPPCPCWSAIRFSKTDQWRLELWKLIKELNLEYLKSPCSVYLTWLLFDLIRN